MIKLFCFFIFIFFARINKYLIRSLNSRGNPPLPAPRSPPRRPGVNLWFILDTERARAVRRIVWRHGGRFSIGGEKKKEIGKPSDVFARQTLAPSRQPLVLGAPIVILYPTYLFNPPEKRYRLRYVCKWLVYSNAVRNGFAILRDRYKPGDRRCVPRSLGGLIRLRHR